MSFIDHLEELRWHIIRAVLSILVFSIVAFFSKEIVFGVLILGPSKPDFWTYRMLCELSNTLGTSAFCIDKLPFTLQSREMSGQFSMHVTSSFIIGLICAFPYAFWELWRFIKPGLYPKEQKSSRGAVFFVSVLFILGVLFGYFVATPMSINFLANYQLDPSITNEFDISSYISTLATLTISCGLMFQLPMVAFFMTKAGVMTPEIMRIFRRHAIVVILILAAIVTPPDVVSQVLISLPLMLLYEASIMVSGAVIKADIKRLNNQTTAIQHAD